MRFLLNVILLPYKKQANKFIYSLTFEIFKGFRIKSNRLRIRVHINLIKNKIYLDSKYKGCSKIKAVIITLL